jgi:hypothetical protein
MQSQLVTTTLPRSSTPQRKSVKHQYTCMLANWLMSSNLHNIKCLTLFL